MTTKLPLIIALTSSLLATAAFAMEDRDLLYDRPFDRFYTHDLLYNRGVPNYRDIAYSRDLACREQSTPSTAWVGYPETSSGLLYRMSSDSQCRGAYAYAGVLRQLTLQQIDFENRTAGIQVSASAQAQVGQLVASKQDRIRQGYAELKPVYDELMRRRRDLKGQDDIHQYNIEAAQYTARLRQLRRDEAEVGMMMRSGARY